MAALRIPTLRHLASCPLRSIRASNQRRWAQVQDVRFLATTQPPIAIVDKYREKLDQKAKAEGLGSINELKTAYADKIEEERKKDAVKYPVPETIPQSPETPVKQPNVGSVPDADSPQAPKAPQPGSDKPAIKSLNDIIVLDKVRTLPEKELTAIWRLRHANSPQNICAVIPASTYKSMEALAREAPQFVLPVPHESQGSEIHFLQWTFDAESKTSTVLFTQLAEYKTRGEFAQPHTTITHHLDLADENGLVLMQGQVVDGRGIQPEHAKWLVLCLQRFYGGWEQDGAELDGQRKVRAEERKKLLQWFSNGDERFSVEKLIDEAERMG